MSKEHPKGTNMTTIIHIDPDLPLHVLDEHGWTQGSFESGDGKVCAHGAIRLCAPVPGDAYLIEQVEGRLGRHSTGWNDDDSTTEADVRAWFAQGIDITDADLEATFGPQWRAVVSLVRRAAILTSDEGARLDAAGDAAWVIVTYDLATPDGPYTIEHRDLLLAPWIKVCGMPEGLVS